jgi:hypothetical protein
LKIGTRSLLFGAHQFLLHPLCLAIAWTKLYGFPRDFRLWAAFFLHDIGYFGCRDMDGLDGQHHPELGAKIMGRLFGHEWEMFCLGHSRFHAHLLGIKISRLCIADKLATAIVPAWLYLPMVKVTGELPGYMAISNVLGNAIPAPESATEWHRGMQTFLFGWVRDHREKTSPDPACFCGSVG